MTTIRSFINRFISFFLLLFFHLGCCFIPTTISPTKRRRLSPPPPPPPPVNVNANAKSHRRRIALSFFNPWSHLKPILSSFKKPSETESLPHVDPPPLSSARSSQYTIPSPPRLILSTPTRKRSSGSFTESDISSDPQAKHLSISSFRNEIFPCPTCGEVFHKTSHLEHHQSTKHAVTELLDGDSSKNIVRIIFQTGWSGKENRAPSIQRILKIHNSTKILARFEEYREVIKIKAARSGGGRRHERCIADGNELLRFHCSTFICSLGEDGGCGICGQEYCSVCGIIRSGFSAKLDGISTMGSSRRAHEVIPEEMEEEFAFMKVRRAMLVCRVVAGRVASAEKEDGGFDSVVVGSGTHREGEELLVFNPRAVFPCFVIVYTV